MSTTNSAAQTHRTPVNRISGLPSRPGTIFLGGAAIIGGLFAGTWYYMSAKQARKASREPGERGSLPSWEYRILQAVEPVRGTGADSGKGAGAGAASRPDVRSAAAIEPRSPPLDAPNRDPADRAQHRTLSPGGEEALRAENGAKMQPTPQRDRGDGLAYTKRLP